MHFDYLQINWGLQQLLCDAPQQEADIQFIHKLVQFAYNMRSIESAVDWTKHLIITSFHVIESWSQIQSLHTVFVLFHSDSLQVTDH